MPVSPALRTQLPAAESFSAAAAAGMMTVVVVVCVVTATMELSHADII